MSKLLPFVLLLAACGGNPRPRQPSSPSNPVIASSPAPVEPKPTPQRPRPEPGPCDDPDLSEEKAGMGGTPCEPPAHISPDRLVWICHVSEDGMLRLTRHIPEGSPDKWGSARWHIEKHAPNDYRGECGRKHKEQ